MDPIPHGHFILNRCGNPLCFYIGHLDISISNTKIVKVGDKYLNKAGYVLVSSQNPTKRTEHTIIMEKILGRSLLTGENIHHINGIKGL